MSPLDFIRNPLLWGLAMEKWNATGTSAPNFAYGLLRKRMMAKSQPPFDLSSLTIANNGAEPVDPMTLDETPRIGIPKSAILQAYGLAESVLTVCAMSHGLSREGLPRCGNVTEAATCGTHVVIAGDEPYQSLPDGTVGQIFVQSPSLASGYWQRNEATQATFHNRLRGKDGVWLATGDFGFIEADNAVGDRHLCVTGRLKDLIIIRGRNVYPTDIERVVIREGGDGILRPGCCVAVQHGQTGVAVVAELYPKATFTEADKTRVFGAVQRECEVRVTKLILLHKGRIPKTTSGKLKRLSVARRTGAKAWRNSAVAFDFGEDLPYIEEDTAAAENSIKTSAPNSGGALSSSGGHQTRRESLRGYLAHQLKEEEEEEGEDDSAAEGKSEAPTSEDGLTRFSDRDVTNPDLRQLFDDFRTGSTERCFLGQLRKNVERMPDRVVFTWLGERGQVAKTLTFGQLWESSGRVADLLVQKKGLQPGDRVMIVYPFGLEFLEGFVACLRAGSVVCSVYPPNP
jgi:acyl-CoA synthetase (AMP-forming)/AMP-acid ligase II